MRELSEVVNEKLIVEKSTEKTKSKKPADPFEGKLSVFADRLVSDPSFLDLWSYMDECGGQSGWGTSKFLGRYGAYLIQKSITFGLFDFEVERRIQAEGTDWIKAFEEKKLFKLGGYVQKQFDAALECETEFSGIDVHPIASCACIQMLKDSFYLYTFQSILIYYILGKIVLKSFNASYFSL